MNAWDALINRLTDRLQVDPELRMDVARELRCHLEDSAAEFRRAGQDVDEAAASAAKALGDPEELAGQLWQANRRRVRIRGLLRWAARIALAPAAAAVILALVVAMVGRGCSYVRPKPSVLAIGGPTPEQRFILHGDPAATDPIAKARSISDRWPDNPVYYANYVVELTARGGFFDREGKIKPERLDELLAVLEEGERIDPDNAFYNFKKAGILAQASSRLHEDTSRDYYKKPLHGLWWRKHPWRIEIHDKQFFERALAELRRGLGKKTATGRMVEMARVRLAQLPEPRGVSDVIGRLMPQAQVATRINHRAPEHHLARALSAGAIGLAEEGKAAEAEEMVEAGLRMGGMIGGHGESLMEVLIGNRIVMRTLAHARHAYLELGRDDQAHEAGEAFEEEVAYYQRLRGGGPPADKGPGAGLYWAAFGPCLPGLKRDFAPIRSAEKYFFTELALLWLLCVLAGMGLVAGLVTLVSLAIRRGDGRAVLLFVGWRRIGRICLLGLVAPVAAYFLYAWVLTGRDGQFGLNYTAGKTMLEYTIVILAVLVLVTRLSYSAIRARAEEIGMPVPPPVTLRDRRVLAGAAAAVALAAAVYLIGWWAGPFRPEVTSGYGYPSIPGFILAAVVVAYMVAAALREGFSRVYRGPFARFRRSFMRSFVPILASVVIVLGIACGWPLARGERAAVSAAKGQASLDLLVRQVEDSDYRLLRQRLAARAAPAPKRPE